MRLVFLVPLYIYYHPVLQGCPHLVSFLGLAAFSSEIVKSVGPSMSLAVSLSSCSWVRLWESVRLMIVIFSIVSLYFIVIFSNACSSFTLITWAFVLCAWFAEAPYTWAVAVDFFGSISACMLAQSDPWSPTSYFVWPEYLPNSNRLFTSPQFLESMQYWPLPPLGLDYLQLLQTPLLPQFDQTSIPLGLGDTIIDSFLFTFCNVHRWYFSMIVIQVLYDTWKCVVGIVGVILALNLEIFFVQLLKELLLEDVLWVHRLEQLVHLGRMLLDPP